MLVALSLRIIVFHSFIVVGAGEIPVQCFLHLRIVQVVPVVVLVLHTARHYPIFDFGDLAEGGYRHGVTTPMHAMGWAAASSNLRFWRLCRFLQLANRRFELIELFEDDLVTTVDVYVMVRLLFHHSKITTKAIIKCCWVWNVLPALPRVFIVRSAPYRTTSCGFIPSAGCFRWRC